MKKVILVLILSLVIIDVLVVMKPSRYFLGAMAVWFRGRSQCSLAELWSEIDRGSNMPALDESAIAVERTEAGLDLWKTPQGPIWTAHGDTILPFLMSEQLHDIYEPRGHEVQKGDIVLDCGANIGVFTRKALDRGARLVVGIEPAPQTVAAYRRNFEKEIREGRVIAYPKGVWDRDAELELAIHVDNEGFNSLVKGQDAGAQKVKVPLTTIDKIVAELNLPRVDFIKMDIEGAEKQALKGGEGSIKRFRPRMSLSTEHLDDDITAIPAAVHAIDSNYKQKACDCTVENGGVKALVMAFDPVP